MEEEDFYSKIKVEFNTASYDDDVASDTSICQALERGFNTYVSGAHAEARKGGAYVRSSVSAAGAGGAGVGGAGAPRRTWARPDAGDAGRLTVSASGVDNAGHASEHGGGECLDGGSDVDGDDGGGGGGDDEHDGDGGDGGGDGGGGDGGNGNRDFGDLGGGGGADTTLVGRCRLTPA